MNLGEVSVVQKSDSNASKENNRLGAEAEHQSKQSKPSQKTKFTNDNVSTENQSEQNEVVEKQSQLVSPPKQTRLNEDSARVGEVFSKKTKFTNDNVSAENKSERNEIVEKQSQLLSQSKQTKLNEDSARVGEVVSVKSDSVNANQESGESADKREQKAEELIQRLVNKHSSVILDYLKEDNGARPAERIDELCLDLYTHFDTWENIPHKQVSKFIIAKSVSKSLYADDPRKGVQLKSLSKVDDEQISQEEVSYKRQLKQLDALRGREFDADMRFKDLAKKDQLFHDKVVGYHQTRENTKWSDYSVANMSKREFSTLIIEPNVNAVSKYLATFRNTLLTNINTKVKRIIKEYTFQKPRFLIMSHIVTNQLKSALYPNGIDFNGHGIKSFEDAFNALLTLKPGFRLLDRNYAMRNLYNAARTIKEIDLYFDLPPGQIDSYIRLSLGKRKQTETTTEERLKAKKCDPNSSMNKLKRDDLEVDVEVDVEHNCNDKIKTLNEEEKGKAPNSNQHFNSENINPNSNVISTRTENLSSMLYMFRGKYSLVSVKLGVTGRAFSQFVNRYKTYFPIEGLVAMANRMGQFSVVPVKNIAGKQAEHLLFKSLEMFKGDGEHFFIPTAIDEAEFASSNGGYPKFAKHSLRGNSPDMIEFYKKSASIRLRNLYIQIYWLFMEYVAGLEVAEAHYYNLYVDTCQASVNDIIDQWIEDAVSYLKDDDNDRLDNTYFSRYLFSRRIVSDLKRNGNRSITKIELLERDDDPMRFFVEDSTPSQFSEVNLRPRESCSENRANEVLQRKDECGNLPHAPFLVDGIGGERLVSNIQKRKPLKKDIQRKSQKKLMGKRAVACFDEEAIESGDDGNNVAEESVASIDEKIENEKLYGKKCDFIVPHKRVETYFNAVQHCNDSSRPKSSNILSLLQKCIAYHASKLVRIREAKSDGEQNLSTFITPVDVLSNKNHTKESEERLHLNSIPLDQSIFYYSYPVFEHKVLLEMQINRVQGSDIHRQRFDVLIFHNSIQVSHLIQFSYYMDDRNIVFTDENIYPVEKSDHLQRQYKVELNLTRIDVNDILFEQSTLPAWMILYHIFLVCGLTIFVERLQDKGFMISKIEIPIIDNNADADMSQRSEYLNKIKTDAYGLLEPYFEKKIDFTYLQVFSQKSLSVTKTSQVSALTTQKSQASNNRSQGSRSSYESSFVIEDSGSNGGDEASDPSGGDIPMKPDKSCYSIYVKTIDEDDRIDDLMRQFLKERHTDLFDEHHQIQQASEYFTIPSLFNGDLSDLNCFAYFDKTKSHCEKLDSMKAYEEWIIKEVVIPNPEDGYSMVLSLRKDLRWMKNSVNEKTYDFTQRFSFLKITCEALAKGYSNTDSNGMCGYLAYYQLFNSTADKMCPCPQLHDRVTLSAFLEFYGQQYKSENETDIMERVRKTGSLLASNLENNKWESFCHILDLVWNNCTEYSKQKVILNKENWCSTTLLDDLDVFYMREFGITERILFTKCSDGEDNYNVSLICLTTQAAVKHNINFQGQLFRKLSTPQYALVLIPNNHFYIVQNPFYNKENSILRSLNIVYFPSLAKINCFFVENTENGIIKLDSSRISNNEDDTFDLTVNSER